MIRAGNCWLKEETVDAIYVNKNNRGGWTVYLAAPCGNFEYKSHVDISDAIDCANKLSHKLMGEETNIV